jgi:hypothetical protein
MGYLFIIKKDLPRIRQNISGEEVDESCFACTIRANDGGEHSFLNFEVNFICGADHTEIFPNFFRSEEIRHLTTGLP